MTTIEPIEHEGHLLSQDSEAHYNCSICGQRWKFKPSRECPKIPVFTGLWKDAFVKAEQVLGYKPLTKRQLDEAGFQTGKNLPAPCAAMPYSENPSGFLFVYNPSDAKPKRSMNGAQQAALAKAQEATRERYHCQFCRNRLQKHEYGQKHCDHCEMVLWARETIERGAFILGARNLGLDDEDEIVQLAIMDTSGNVYLSTLIQPYNHLLTYEENTVNGLNRFGINSQMLDIAPGLHSIYDRLAFIVEMGKKFVVWDRDTDISVLEAMLKRYDLEPLEFAGYSIDGKYAQWFGVQQAHYSYRRRYSGWSYAHQPLSPQENTALGDCRAILEKLEEMAK